MKHCSGTNFRKTTLQSTELQLYEQKVSPWIGFWKLYDYFRKTSFRTPLNHVNDKNVPY